MSDRTITDKVHSKVVYNRRLEVLCKHLCEIIPQNSKVLDVGCGDGNLDRMIMEKRKDLSIVGIDLFVRPNSFIAVKTFDGVTIPYGDDEFDTVMFVDVLHHTDDANILLQEAARVAKSAVVIKDHTRNGFLANKTLSFMDTVGNAKHGVRLPYNYWSKSEWDLAFDKLKLVKSEYKSKLNIYPFPADLIFGRTLHFIARLTPNQS